VAAVPAVTRRVVVEADGGSRGNPGPAGYGAVVRDADTGEVLAEVAEGIGVASNNVAEYRGLIAALEAALDLGADAVDVRMDSLLVVNQMSEKWKIKHEAMRPLASQAAALVRRFGGRVTFAHIPRALNSHADRLANQAMDDAARGLAWTRREPGEAAEPEPRRRSRGAAGPANTLYGWSAPTGPPTRLLLLRHGETALTAEKRFSGRGDVALTDRGLEQARRAGERLASYAGVAAVVSSPLRRAMQTAEVVAAALGLPVVADDDLAETDFGDWEGATFAEVRERWPEQLQAWLDSPDVAPPGGESFTATFARVAAARERIVAAHPDASVVVVSHVTPIKTLVRQALDAPPHALYRLYLDPASLTSVNWFADARSVVTSFNDVGHLQDLPLAAGR
jgi:ribonuclease H / adenosylcobalamin/alpha-ribazole phosphatase